MAQGVRLILEGMGVDLTDPNYRETPKRVARMYASMLSPQKNNWKTFPAQRSDLVILRKHRVFALCPHHLLPVELTCYVGYIPNKRVLGLSKLARVIEEQLTAPILQEDLAHGIADALDRRVEPKGIGVVLIGVHGCMRFRGVESTGDISTSVVRGALLHEPSARAEFFQLLETAR